MRGNAHVRFGERGVETCNRKVVRRHSSTLHVRSSRNESVTRLPPPAGKGNGQVGRHFSGTMLIPVPAGW